MWQKFRYISVLQLKLIQTLIWTIGTFRVYCTIWKASRTFGKHRYSASPTNWKYCYSISCIHSKCGERYKDNNLILAAPSKITNLNSIYETAPQDILMFVLLALVQSPPSAITEEFGNNKNQPELLVSTGINEQASGKELSKSKACFFYTFKFA